MSRWNVSATGATENAFVVEEDDFDETGKLVVPIPESKKKIVLHRISHATISGIPDHVESISFHSCPGTTSIPKRLPSKLTSLTFIYTPIQFESVDDAMPERLLDLSIVASPLVFLPRVAPPKMRFLTIVGCANLTTLPRAVPASMHYVGIMDSGLVTEAEVLACVAPTHVHRNFDEFHFFVPRYPDAERKIKIIHDRYWTMVFMDAFRSKASGPPRSYPSDVVREAAKFF